MSQSNAPKRLKEGFSATRVPDYVYAYPEPMQAIMKMGLQTLEEMDSARRQNRYAGRQP